MKKISFLILGLIFLIPLAASNQAILSVADSLLASGNRYAAITEFKRYVSYEGQNPVAGSVYLQIALAHRDLAEHSEALKYVEKAIYAAETDSLRADYLVEKAIILMNAQNLSLAEFILFRETHTGGFQSIRERAHILLGLNYILQAKWSEATATIGEYALLKGRADDPEVKSLLGILAENSLVQPKAPKLAKRLSTWLPGLGQFYAGDWRNGVNSLTINSAIIWWLLSSALQGNYVQMLPIAYVLWKYYQGGRVRAEMIATGKNRDLKKNRVQAAASLLGVLLEKN